MSKKVNDIIDVIEFSMLSDGEKIYCPVTHKFAPGMYIREIFMPAGINGKENIITSMTHKAIHPFFILKGSVTVFSENNGVEKLEAPYSGITYSGTRRVLRIDSDCIWCTVHRTDIRPNSASKEDIEEAVNLICEEIIEQRPNKLLGGVLKNNTVIPMIEGNNINSQLIESQ